MLLEVLFILHAEFVEDICKNLVSVLKLLKVSIALAEIILNQQDMRDSLHKLVSCVDFIVILDSSDKFVIYNDCLVEGSADHVEVAEQQK